MFVLCADMSGSWWCCGECGGGTGWGRRGCGGSNGCCQCLPLMDVELFPGWGDHGGIHCLFTTTSLVVVGHVGVEMDVENALGPSSTCVTRELTIEVVVVAGGGTCRGGRTVGLGTGELKALMRALANIEMVS